MNIDSFNKSYFLHRAIAIVSIVTVGFLLATMDSMRVTMVDAVVFQILSMRAFFRELDNNMSYNGYGVNKEINYIIGGTILEEYEPAWRGFAVEPAAACWKRNTVLDFGMTVLGAAALYFSGMAEFLHPLGEVSVIFGAAYLSATVGNVYVWLMVDRLRQWYLFEGLLYLKLQSIGWTDKAIAEVLMRARNAGLLSTKD